MEPTPHKCPVCEGRGTVPEGFYPDEGDRPLECRTCKGAGVLWHPSVEGFNSDLQWRLSVDSTWSETPSPGSDISFVDLQPNLDAHLWEAIELLSTTVGFSVLSDQGVPDDWLDMPLDRAQQQTLEFMGPVPCRNVPAASDIDDFHAMVGQALSDWTSLDLED